MDERKEFIISTAGRYFCISPESFTLESYGNNEVLNDFLDTSKMKPMYVILVDSKLIFKEALTKENQSPDLVRRLLIFFKTNPDPVSSENYLHTILVLSVNESFLRSLYYAVQDIFTPAILQGYVPEVRPNLASLFEKLEEEMRSTLFSTPRASGEINSIDDELLYWKMVEDSTHKKLNADVRKYLLNSMQYLSSQIKNFGSLTRSDVDDTLENIMNILDDVWKHDFKYPSHKMARLLTIIGNELVRSLQINLKGTENWHDPLTYIEDKLKDSITLCEKWNQITKKLTFLYWPNYANNPWTEEEFVPSYSNGFMERLKEVLKLRMIFTQLQIALVDFNKDMDYVRLLKPFEEVNYLLYNYYTEPKWRSAVNIFYNVLGVIEQDIVDVFQLKFQVYGSNLTAVKLRNHNKIPLHMADGTRQFKGIPNSLQGSEIDSVSMKRRSPFLQIRQSASGRCLYSLHSKLIMEFSRFDLLLQLPTVLNSLSTERQNFLEQIQYNVSSIYPAALVEGVETVTGTLEVSQLVYPIAEARINLNKLEIYLKFAKDTLSDIRGYDELIADIAELRRKLKELEEKQFKSWTDKMLTSLKANEFRFATTDPVVYFQSEKLLQVNFSDKLFDLINDTRKLTAYGFTVDQRVVDAASKAKQFLGQAKLLFQVASFHNTMSERIITSQSPMMLNSARELARLVQTEHSVTWENSREVNDYIKRMQSAVENLANENNRLVNYHSMVMRKVESLALAPVSDFIKQNDVWLRTLSEIRSIVDEVEEKFTDTMAWRRHIDLQICKVLDVKYRWYLDTIEEHLPEMQIMLVYKNHKVEYSPSLCVVKRDYFRKIKDSIDKLLEIKGIGDEKLYSTIKDKNCHKFASVTSCIDILFSKLQEYSTTWRSWLSISRVDIESFFKSYKSIKSEDWNRNFRASKFFGQQIAKIPSSQMVGPFYVSLVPLKMSIEWLNRSSWNTLREMLKISILEDVDVINMFVSQVRAIADNQAQKAEEFINFRVEHKNLERELESVMLIAANLEHKNTLLRSWAREVVPSVTDATAALAQAKSKLKNYDALLQQQIDVFRVKVHAQAKQLITSIQLFFIKWNEEKPSENLLQQAFTFQELKSIMVPIRERKAQWGELKEEVAKTKSDFIALDIEPPDFGEYSESTVSLEDVLQQMGILEEFHDGLDQLGQEEWMLISSRAYQITISYLEDWKMRLKPMQPSILAHRIIEDIVKIEEFLPHLEFLRGDVLTDKHWANILEILNIQKSKDKLIYADLLARMDAITSHSDALKAINAQAASEIGIIQALSELDAWEVEAKFSTYEHNNFKGEIVQLIKDVKGISNKIGDYQCLLQSIKASSSLTTFADRVTIWENRLNNLDQCIQDVIQVQRKWAYLEPIFGNWNLEGIKFERINKEWSNILVQLSDSSFRVAALSRMPNIYIVLQNLLQSLSQCQRALQNFLEGKRLQFPRFYFLNDDDLLEILGQSDKAHIIQSHLKKIFVGIHSVEIENRGGGDVITAVYSAQGESVVLNKEVGITPKAEEWLTELSEEVKSTLKALVVSCITKPDPDRFPSQVLCLSERINFTRYCEEAITTNGLSHYRSALETQHAAYSKQLLELNGSKMEKHGVLHLKLKDLLFDTIYHLGIVKTLIKTEVKHTDDWNWQKILRFYCDTTGSVHVKMVDAQFEYTYEYQGNIAKLVHTSLTDKCYLTLTQAASLGFGGNPYGPAGTGKTESVKALGALLGRQVLVFNCDEGLDADSLMRIMIGIIKSGAWGCFDEFNRLDETTLSLISLQISIIQHALRNKSATVTLTGREVSLDNNSGIFITLNPAGKGYGGRQKLPENLKQLFRPVLMSKPDDREITQVILHCEGFTKAEQIGQKIVTLFGQARSLLSHQQHYDFGLRAIKTVVGSCGSSLRKFLSSNQSASSSDEYKLAVNAVRLNTRCKLTHSDAIRFDELIKDIFPNVDFISSGRDDILLALQEAYKKLNLVYDVKQSSKCIELLEQMEQRMGVVVVGPQSSGKTTLTLLLKCALEIMGVKVRHDWFNPKSMPRNQLLGQIDVDTRQWTDGLLTNIAQSVYNEPPDVQCWVHSDGDVDPEWVESLNSVLDDNHLLTLPSGWRIQFGDNVHFIFETHDLQFASPATISRMGIILMSNRDLDYHTCIQQHLRDQSLGSHALSIIESTLPVVMKELQNVGCFDKSSKSIPGILQNTLPFLGGIISKTQLTVRLAQLIGPMVPESRREMLTNKIFQVVLNDDRKYNNYNLLCYNESDDSVGYHPNQYVHTKDHLTLTPSMIPLTDLLQDYVMKGHPFILIAPAGSGKSVITNHIFREIPSIQVVLIDCSAYLQPHHIIQRLNQECITVTRNSRRTIMPKHAERVVVHFSDLDGVHEDRYGTRVLIEFLKQAIERKGFYDDSFEWIGLENITFIFSVRYIDGLPARFIDLLNIVYMKPITISEQKEVIAMWGKMKFNDVDCRLIYDALAKLIDNIHRKSTDEKGNQLAKYMFTLREYDKLIDNLARHNLSDKSSMVDAYICEARRVLKDQIDDIELRRSFEEHLNDSIKSSFGMDYAGLLYEDSYYIMESQKQNLSGRSQIPPPQGFIKFNEEDWKAEVRLACVQLGNVFTEHILLVPDFLELVAKIEFILRQPGGSILFPSKPGSGKKTALQIVSQRINASIYMLKLNAGYSVSNFQNDLKMIIQTAGIAGETVILILEDFQIIDPEFLNMVSCLVSHGEVFGLYSPEEYEALASQLKSSMESEGYEDTSISYLRKRVHHNVHLVLMYEHDNVSFIELFRSNPSLPKLCYTIYSNEFSSDTMFTIPEEILKNLEKISGFLATMHGETKRLIPKTTPLSFFYAIRTYLKFFNEKRSELLDRKQRLQVGVTKISEAQSLVDKLKFEANEQKLLLDERQARGRLVLDQISDTMTKANFRKNEMEKLKVDAVTKNTTLVARKAEIDKEMESITPLVEAAQSAVGNIKPEALTEIRSLRVPPKIIRDILEAVLCLMGILDTSWSSMKSFLAGRGIRDEIRFFDAQQITDENRSSVLKLLQANKESFDIKNARRASVAAAPLAAWVQANVKYSIVLEKIRPLNEELADLERNLSEAGEQIVELETALANVDDTVTELKDQLSSSTREAAEIELRLASAQKTISAAEGLVSKLNDEYLVWNKQLTELSKSMDTLPTNCAISAGFVTYLASADFNTRGNVVESWEASLDSRGLVSVKEFLMTERDILHWQSEGLPGDEYSLQNTAILLNTMMPLLLLDPASTAAKFLVNHFQDAKVESISIKSTKFVNSLELAVKFGKVLVVLDADEIHPMLIPILRQEFVYQGPRRMVYVGNKIVDYDINFRIFMTTRSLNMKQRASIPGFIYIVNYSPTVEGLTQQLLSSTLRLEKPDLERRRLELLQEEEQLKNKLFFLQEKVLKELADSQGDILQNQELLGSLKNTKESSDAIKKSLDEAVQIKETMAKECMVYESFALLGTRIFFACASLSNINNMYHLSVGKYIALFEKSLKHQKQEISMPEKSQNLIIFIYQYICRSLFKDDRLAFALQLIHAVYAETINPGEWEFFIGKTPLNESFDSSQLEELPGWITRELQTADEILHLKVHCPNLYDSLKLEDANEWMRFVKQTNPRLPEHCALTPFQYILVLKALRPDMLHNELTNYSLQKLGLTSLSPDVLKLNTLLDESDASVPILIITSPGTDPSEELRSLAVVKNIKNMKEMVLGPGLEGTTIITLREASERGSWVLLKNLHLVIHWLPVLENEIRQLSPHSHDSFRLWMTTESHNNFSEVLLSASLKISYEAPPGIKNNLLRTYHEWETQHALEASYEGGRAMFILSWFHALIQERRSYIPQGWTSFYEFNDVDLSVATSILKKIISKGKNGQIQWQFVRGLYEYAVYGGRVNNVFDLRVLSAYLNFFFSQEIFKKNGRPLVGNVYLPESASIEDHFKVINLLPSENEPEYFGLPPNVEVIRHRVVIRKLYEQFKELDKSSSLQEILMEDMTKSVEDLWSLWTLIKERLNMRKFTNLDSQWSNSILTYLGLEIEFATMLIEDVDASFSAVHQTLKQGALPKKGILNFALAIYHQQVPEEWSNIWLGPTNPGSWLESVVAKAIAVQSLHDSMKEESLSMIEMSNVFHGADFFMALKQDAARARSLEMDLLTLKCSLDSEPSSANGSMLITGILLQGALMVNGFLEMTHVDSLSVSEAPPLTVTWELKEESLHDFVPIPLYSNESRDEVITELQVSCKKGEKTKWIKAGTAFYVRA